MKRMVKLLAVAVLLAMLSVACNQYVCPAYTIDDKTTEVSEELPA
jgi:hypothetical protein